MGVNILERRTEIVIVTDAWYPQVNGVVTTYKNIIENLPPNYDVELIEPSQFKTIKFPFYNEISLALVRRKKMYRLLRNLILRLQGEGTIIRFHIATEGPLGLQAKRVLTDLGIQYTTAYHTKFPEFAKAMWGIPTSWTQWYFDWFHRDSKLVITSSRSSSNENPNWHSAVMEKGYDEHFRLHHPIEKSFKTLLYVGRVSKEKNIEEFCKLYIPGVELHKVVVGNGPDRKRLKKKYPDIEFAGYKFGDELASYYKTADVFVFPSCTDTYGIVILEAMACGTPVAAFPVTGPRDQIVNGVNGYMNSDLAYAVTKCFEIPRAQVHNTVKNISWRNSAQQFVNYVD